MSTAAACAQLRETAITHLDILSAFNDRGDDADRDSEHGRALMAHGDACVNAAHSPDSREHGYGARRGHAHARGRWHRADVRGYAARSGAATGRKP